MNRGWLTLAGVLGLAVATWGQTGPAGNDDAFTVLRMIPADLPFAAVVVDFTELDRNVTAFVRRVDPDATDTSILDDIKEDIGIAEWVDFTRPFGFGAAQLGPGDDEKVLWAAVPDFAQKVKSTDGATQEGGMWRLPLKEGEDLYVKVVGEYVVGATTMAALKRATAEGPTLADQMRPRIRLFQGRDVVMHLNVDPVRDTALAGLASAAQMAPMMAMMVGQQGGADPQVMATLFQAFFDAGKRFMEQVAYVDLALGLSTKAADLTVATGYKEGPIKTYLAKQEPASVAPFTEIEEQPYLAAIAYHLPGKESPVMDYLIEHAVAAVRAATAATAAAANTPAGAEPAAPAKTSDEATLNQAAQALRELVHQVEGVNALTAISAGRLKGVGDYISASPEEFLRLLTRNLAANNPVLVQLKGGATFEALGSKKIGSTTVEEFAIDPGPGNPAGDLLGKDPRFVVGVLGGRVRYGSGSDADLQNVFRDKISRPLSSARYVREALSALPDRRNAVVLIDLAGALPILGPAAGKADLQPLPPGPAIGISTSMCGEPARLDIHVPLRAIERVVLAMSPPEPPEPK